MVPGALAVGQQGQCWSLFRRKRKFLSGGKTGSAVSSQRSLHEDPRLKEEGPETKAGRSGVVKSPGSFLGEEAPEGPQLGVGP